MSQDPIPTFTVMKHATTDVYIKKPTQSLKNFIEQHRRLHDPPLTGTSNGEDVEQVTEAASLLMLDLGITEKNCKQHRVLVVSSPYQKCIETAVIVSQAFGVESFYVHFGLGASVLSILASGWDWAKVPLYLSSSEMNQLVTAKSRRGERQGKKHVIIAGFLGKPQSLADTGENDRDFTGRIYNTLDEIMKSLERPGDHMIAIGHHDTITNFGKKYGDNMEIFEDQDCSFVTFAVPSEKSCWVTGRSRLKFIPR